MDTGRARTILGWRPERSSRDALAELIDVARTSTSMVDGRAESPPNLQAVLTVCFFCGTLATVSQVRRTQLERSTATQAALLGATIETLVEHGYRRTTTSEVARRAGVSYGALLHHFPTKTDLLCAAVGHLFEQRLTEFRKAMADLPPEAPKAEAAIDVLWTMFQGPTFTAWLELWVAARTDAELARAIADVDQQFVDTSQGIFRELFAEESADNPDLPTVAIGLTYAVLDGLALSRLVPGYEPVPAADLLGVFKLLISTALPTAPERTAQP
jgi:AcrR family transcriptional regulator